MTTTTEIDALAEYFGVNLWIDQNEETGEFGIWCEMPDAAGDDCSDIIGTGATVEEAIESARRTLVKWESPAEESPAIVVTDASGSVVFSGTLADFAATQALDEDEMERVACDLASWEAATLKSSSWRIRTA